MRYPEGKVKEAILHPDPDVRNRAVGYFARSSRPDPAIMPLVIRAVETYGRADAGRLIGLSRDLPQSAESVAWVVDELNAEQTDQYETTRTTCRWSWRRPIRPCSGPGKRPSWRPATFSPTCAPRSLSGCGC